MTYRHNGDVLRRFRYWQLADLSWPTERSGSTEVMRRNTADRIPSHRASLLGLAPLG
jgi:hypothetical protein